MSKYINNFNDWVEQNEYEYYDFVDSGQFTLDKSIQIAAPSSRLMAKGQEMLFHLIGTSVYERTITGGETDRIPNYGEASIPLLKSDDFLSMGITWCLTNGFNPHEVPVVISTTDAIYWAYLADLKMKILEGHNGESLGAFGSGGRAKFLYPLSCFKPIETMPIFNTIQLDPEILEMELGI